MAKNINVTKQMLAQARKAAMKRAAIFEFSKKSANEIAKDIRYTGATFLMSYEWKVLRRRAIEKYGAKCMKCGRCPRDPKKINVDHVKPRKLFPHLALDFDNLQVLCASCNKEKGNKNQIDYRS